MLILRVHIVKKNLKTDIIKTIFSNNFFRLHYSVIILCTVNRDTPKMQVYIVTGDNGLQEVQ